MLNKTNPQSMLPICFKDYGFERFFRIKNKNTVRNDDANLKKKRLNELTIGIQQPMALRISP